VDDVGACDTMVQAPTRVTSIDDRSTIGSVMRAFVESLPAWVLYLHYGAALLLSWVAFSTWRLSWPGSGYMGITREYWWKLAIEIVLALVAVLTSVALWIAS
jgi:hypothetical protein